MATEAEETGTNEIQEVRSGDEPLELTQASLFHVGLTEWVPRRSDGAPSRKRSGV